MLTANSTSNRFSAPGERDGNSRASYARNTWFDSKTRQYIHSVRETRVCYNSIHRVAITRFDPYKLFSAACTGFFVA